MFLFTASCPATAADYRHKFRCTVCNKMFSLRVGGADYVRRYSETKTHNDNAKQKATKYLFLKMFHLKDFLTW